MAYELTTRREHIWTLVANYAILVAAAVVGLRFGKPLGPTWRAVVIAVLIAIAVLQVLAPTRPGIPRWQLHAHLAVYAVLVAIPLFLQPGWTMYPILYVLPIMWSMLILPRRQAAAWTVVFDVITAASFVAGFNLAEGATALFLYGAVYAVMGVFAGVLARADAARRQSLGLLAELQEAHRQLQEYALRAEELAVVEERNRLAREMHDTLGHHLTVASVQLEGAGRLCTTDHERAAAMVETVRDEVREALAELRAAVRTLRAPIETDLHLLSSLPRLADHFEKATGITVNKALPDALPSLPDAHRLALFRAAQEALTNVEKHAGASQVWLVLTAGSDAITLLVSDDGKGIGEGAARPGFGLQGLSERAWQLGGELYVEPRAGGGTQLSYRLPLPCKEDHA